MKPSLNTTFRTVLGALAVMGASVAMAQPAVPPAHDAHHAQPAKKMHKPAHKNHHGAGKYATPHAHEAAAVAADRHHAGKGHHADIYQRNALKRCDVFKVEDDRRACVERVRQPQISGSVAGGGVIREYTQTVQLPPPHHAPGHAPAHAPGHVPPTDHLLHPPVKPVH